MTAHPNPAKAVECVEQLLARDWSMVVQTDEYRAGRERANDDVRQALADAADARVFAVAPNMHAVALEAVMALLRTRGEAGWPTVDTRDVWRAITYSGVKP